MEKLKINPVTGELDLVTVLPTNEELQDSVFGILTDTPTIDLNYDDVGNQVTATVIDNSIDNTKLSQMPANSIKLNPTNTTANAQNFLINPNSLVGRDITGDITNYPITNFMLSNAPLGNILFVSALAPVINDSQTRTQALGRIDKPFRSIQSAVNVSASNDIIYIFSGTYNENLSIGFDGGNFGKLYNIFGEDKNTTFINGNVEGSSILGYNLKNLRIKKLQFTAIFGNTTTVKIENCIVNESDYLNGSLGVYNYKDCIFESGVNHRNFWGGTIIKYDNCILKQTSFNVGDFDIPNSTYIFKNCTLENNSINKYDAGEFPYFQYENCKFINTGTNNLTLINAGDLVNLINCYSNKPIEPTIMNFHNFHNNSNII